MFGPKIMLLLPIWLMGVALHRGRPVVPAMLAWPCVIAPIVIYLVARYLELQRYAWWFNTKLPFEPYWSSGFAWLYFVGVLVSIHLIGFRCLRDADWILALERPIRWLASQSMSLYLFQFPLICFFAGLVPMPSRPVLRGVIIIAATLVSVHLLARVSEARKSQWRRVLHAGATPIGAKVVRPKPV